MPGPSCIVLVSIDDLRFDCFGNSANNQWIERYGVKDRVETPTFDRLIEDNVSFDVATSTASHTPPTHASMLTGCYPKESGVRTFFTPLDPRVQTVAEYLSERGYRTCAWVENLALDMLDVTRGFDEFVSPFEDSDANLFEFVHERSDKDKLFLFIHLFDVHKPYMYSTGGRERERYNNDYIERVESLLGDIVDITALIEQATEEAADDISNYETLSEPLREYGKYRGFDHLIRQELEETLGEERFERLVEFYVQGVTDFDANRFSDLVSVLEESVYDDYLSVITADHGETRCKFRERVDLMNGPNVSEGAVRVPFIVGTDVPELASILPTNRTNLPVSHIDIMPTFADAIGEKPPEDVSGESIFTLLEEDGSNGRVIFHETWYGPEGADFFGNYEVETGEGGLSEVGVRNHPLKVVFAEGVTGTPERAAFDVQRDFFEETNLFGEERFQDLRRALEDYCEDIDTEIEADRTLMSEGQTEDLKDQLGALGYIDDS